MKKALSMLFVVALTVIVAAAQGVTIRGKVISHDDKLPLIGAIVKLNYSDSTKRALAARNTMTDANGQFTITSREPKSDITISFLGYEDYFVQIEQGKQTVDLGTIVMQQGALELGAVEVIANPSMAKVVEDTVQFRASNFKTNPDATAEDLIKKMPGVTTESDGSVSSQGQKIGKVLVNGKEYFESDPAMALKSLPSDAVDNVQMYDDKTDAARFSGFDDGERVRTINIVTRPGVMNSIFGRAYAGYGTDQRYAAGVGANIFMGDQRFTIMVQTNNVNNQGFTLSDISGGGFGMGGGRGMMRSEGVNTGQYMTSAFGGIRQSSMVALNYNGTFKDKLKVSASYNFGNINGEQDQKDSVSYLNEVGRYNSERSYARSYDNRHNLNIRTEWTPDSKNRIIFNPRIMYGLNRGFNTSAYESNAVINLEDDITKPSIMAPAKTNGTVDNGTKYETFYGSADLWWQHAFEKPGRTMSLGAVLNGSKGLGNLDKYLNERTIAASHDYLKDSLVDQLLNLNTSGYTLTGSASYTEPLNSNSRISANYNISYNRTISDQQGLNWDKIEQDYTLLDPSNTNMLNRNYTTQTIGLNYNYVKEKKLTLNLGLDYLMANQNSEQDQMSVGQINSKYFFSSWQPSLNIRLTPKQGQNLNMDIRMSSGFPAVSQLQDVLSIGNTQVTQGNPNLAQSYTTRARISYNIANTDANTNFFLMAYGTHVSDYIATSRTFLRSDTTINGTVINKGKQYITYENMNGYWNAAAFANFSFGIKAIKSNMNIRARYSFSRQPSISDGIEYMSSSHGIGLGVSLTSNISENVDFTFSYDPGINFSKLATSDRLDERFSHNISGFLNIYLTKNLFINMDASWRNGYGSSAGYNQHFTLINAAIGYKFLKLRQAEFKIQAYDLLNQNQSYNQYVSDIQIRETTNYSILKQYFMFSFTYKFDTRKNRNADNIGKDGQGPINSNMPSREMVRRIVINH